jgi:hypothetical protein
VENDTRNQNMGATPQHAGKSPEQEDPPGKLGKVPTTPGSGGGAAETGSPGPGPATRPSGGGKDPAVSHDIPPSAHSS